METKVTVICSEKDGYISAKTLYRIVEIVRYFKCKCLITGKRRTVTADSILMLMALGIQNGDTVTIKCDDKNCVDNICKILQEKIF